MYKLSKKSLEKLEGLDKELVRLVRQAISDSPIDFTVVEGVRSTLRQQQLYSQGRTKEGNIVTYKDGIKNKSKHQQGKAVDLAPWIDGRISWNEKAFRILATHIKQKAKELKINVTWGGDWKSGWDQPHWEV